MSGVYRTIFAMRTLAEQLGAVRRDGAARRIVRDWRTLTGGRAVADRDRRTLVACSGGADSTALVVVLAAACAESVVAGHVVHDLRGEAETRAERDSVAQLAAGLGVEFVESAVAVRTQAGNAEGNARRSRYRELERLAFETGCPFVATGHHADDQLETVLMGLLRGAGVDGMAGVRPRRGLGGRGVELVRPMLGVGRADAERLCGCAGISWAVDPTNADVSRFRAAIRHGVLPGLAAVRPGGSLRASETASHMREVGELLDNLAAGVLARAGRAEGEVSWTRETLRGEHRVVVGAALRKGFGLLHGGRLADSLAARSVRRVVDAVLDGGGDGPGNAAARTKGGTKRFAWKQTEVTVTPDRVTLRRVVDE